MTPPIVQRLRNAAAAIQEERVKGAGHMEAMPPRGAALNMPMSQALRNNLRERSDQPAL